MFYGILFAKSIRAPIRINRVWKMSTVVRRSTATIAVIKLLFVRYIGGFYANVTIDPRQSDIARNVISRSAVSLSDYRRDSFY